MTNHMYIFKRKGKGRNNIVIYESARKCVYDEWLMFHDANIIHPNGYEYTSKIAAFDDEGNAMNKKCVQMFYIYILNSFRWCSLCGAKNRVGYITLKCTHLLNTNDDWSWFDFFFVVVIINVINWITKQNVIKSDYFWIRCD